VIIPFAFTHAGMLSPPNSIRVIQLKIRIIKLKPIAKGGEAKRIRRQEQKKETLLKKGREDVS